MSEPNRFDEIGDAVGWFDRFTLSEAIEIIGPEKAQRVRDAVSAMARMGVLKRIGRGIYEWIKVKS